MSKEIELSSDNCMTIIGSIAVGSKKLHVTYKDRKDRKQVVLQLGDIPDEWTDKQLDEYLKGVKVYLPDGFVPYPS